MQTPMKPELSIIIPVYHEADRIGETIARLKAAIDPHCCEIIVSDGAPDASTIRTLAGPGIVCLKSPKGRAIQMNTGAAAARAPILLFVHADTVLPPNAGSRILAACRRPEIAAGAFELGIDASGAVYRVIEAMVRIRTRITRIPYGDQAIFVKKKVFESLGGYADIPLMEDIELMRRIKKSGLALSLVPEQVRTDARRWQAEGPVYCTLRNNLLSTLFYCGVPARRLKKWYPDKAKKRRLFPGA